MAKFSFEQLHKIKKLIKTKKQTPGQVTKCFFYTAHEAFINVDIFLQSEVQQKDRSSSDAHFRAGYKKAAKSFKQYIIPIVNALPPKAFSQTDIIIRESGILEEMGGMEILLNENSTTLERPKNKPEIIMPKKMSEKKKQKIETITNSIKEILENVMNTLEDSNWIPQWVVDFVKSIFEIIDELFKLLF